MLTDHARRAIITAGRDDAFRRLLPSVKGLAAYQLALDGGLLFLLLVVHVATKFDRFEYKRSETFGFRVFAKRKPLTAQIRDLRRSAARRPLRQPK